MQDELASKRIENALSIFTLQLYHCNSSRRPFPTYFKFTECDSSDIKFDIQYPRTFFFISHDGVPERKHIFPPFSWSGLCSLEEERLSVAPMCKITRLFWCKSNSFHENRLLKTSLSDSLVSGLKNTKIYSNIANFKKESKFPYFHISVDLS